MFNTLLSIIFCAFFLFLRVSAGVVPEPFFGRLLKDFSKDLALRKILTIATSAPLSTDWFATIGSDARITSQILPHNIETKSEIRPGLVDPSFEGVFISAAAGPFSRLNSVTFVDFPSIAQVKVGFWHFNASSAPRAKTIFLYEAESIKRPFYFVHPDDQPKACLVWAFEQEDTNTAAKSLINFYSLADLRIITPENRPRKALLRWATSSDQSTYSQVLAESLHVIYQAFKESKLLGEQEQHDAAIAVYRIANTPHFLLWSMRTEEQRMLSLVRFRVLMKRGKVPGFEND